MCRYARKKFAYLFYSIAVGGHEGKGSGGGMRFTEAEAKAKVGQWVRVRDEMLVRERIAQGILGEVVDAHLYQRAEDGSKEAVWVVCILFYLSRDDSVRVLLHDIGKELYEGSLEEVVAEMSTQNGLPVAPG
jgi:hypothetical protein